ncbi:UDP-4-amino-4,6-dideoxy-N-acetyl-beta-L-altrosamine transaminase [Hydrogenophaga sp.]|uniref:UDP-4-amino-4, 6-dideoxy-N-acetyl-beta-L-altrosamine transaminase n=1 Tax=Hydrogenophaga sp. TaxID=1904254 RepID=UPI002721CBF8|nr:UDP-4-amino-4,6-dideoxy-N-acetyl-beta-L-altrosamine transaminase [Hydrogenophaga sp.]MDO9135095.1 UDP-4-amino-4,6-dideoxy-N-acetyl-beta-L-altrosamine transaminase [Hydrogenophaga sp.]MDO9604123.1 UDP-4-amino-4,6-dideoxy-N-acetyl-beta-L-altrosamine transaminase [Hydrogenophaga sp.]MDP2166093.1 UDP-4-amino-4,6-dideoxy-N-acetyl-beta-L-altrosamine transaminase [Hydrogenophaga sp.]MDP3476656.1 UDP-4-amino-4,6-dideoxy-N-acetyl-beta-L-altrosamine transaminase [Hydrogenophaga sp.]
MDFIPYATQSINEDDLAAVREALTSGWLTQGPAVPRFEQAFAALHSVAHAVAVSNATAGLHIACLALGAGPGKTVWTSPNSFVASANCALYCGAGVDFVDIDPVTRNISLTELTAKLEQAERNGRLPAIVIPVHFGGLACDLVPMRTLADRYGFKILEDASHAVGARYNGQPIGSRYADASVFSFHPVKIVTTGEGGMVTTQDAALARRLQLLRSHGITRETSEMQHPDTGAWHYEQHSLGFNYRMTDIQAALGRSQLQRIDGFHAARERLAERYDQLLAGLPLQRPARVPAPGSTARSSWHLYVVEVVPGPGVADRATVFARLREAGIGVNVHYEPIPLQPYYRGLGFRPGQFPAAEAFASQALSIPLYPSLTEAQQDCVVGVLKKALAG